MPSQKIGLGERVRNDLFCVEWDIKPKKHHVVYGEAYCRRVSVSGRQCREEQSFSSTPLCVASHLLTSLVSKPCHTAEFGCGGKQCIVQVGQNLLSLIAPC